MSAHRNLFFESELDHFIAQWPNPCTDFSTKRNRLRLPKGVGIPKMRQSATEVETCDVPRFS
jgi:hypothetical protein